MLGSPRKFALDSNVFIDAFRSASRNDELTRFRTAFAPFEYMSAVVAQELRSGAQTGDSALRLQRNVFDPLERRGRVFVPTYDAWKRAGECLARMAILEKRPITQIGRTLVNEALLAASCREAGIVLVTSNLRDFARINRVMSIDFVPAWE